MRWTRPHHARESESQGGLIARERLQARTTSDEAADGEVVWSWHPLLVLSPAEAHSAQPGIRGAANPWGDGGKKELVTGEITYKP